MKIYQVSFSGDADGHKGYEYFSSRRAAKSAKKEWDAGPEYHEAVITLITVPLNKAGVLRALNVYASHNDNG